MPRPALSLDLIESLQLEALEKGQQVQCRVYSGSMRPTFEIGDLITVDGQHPKVGEVAVYLREAHWVTHRVVGINDGILDLKGDAHPKGTLEKVEESRIIGRVVSHKRDLRASQIKFLRKIVKRCPTLLRDYLWSNMSPSIQKYVRERSLSGVRVVSE